jgi:hypothetical protein
VPCDGASRARRFEANPETESLSESAWPASDFVQLKLKALPAGHSWFMEFMGLGVHGSWSSWFMDFMVHGVHGSWSAWFKECMGHGVHGSWSSGVLLTLTLCLFLGRLS